MTGASLIMGRYILKSTYDLHTIANIHVHVNLNHNTITQYGSTVYIGIAMGGPALYPYIRILVFTFSFKTSNDIKVENMSKSNCMQKNCMKLSHKVRNTGKTSDSFHLLLLLKTRISLTVALMNLKFCM